MPGERILEAALALTPLPPGHTNERSRRAKTGAANHPKRQPSYAPEPESLDIVKTEDTYLTRGITFALISFAFFATKDAVVRYMDGQVPPFMLGFLGCLLCIAIAPLVRGRGEKLIYIIKPKHPKLWLLRGTIQTVGIISGIIAFTELPMVEAFSLIFLMPVMISLMSIVFLGEKVTGSTWLTIIICFAGTLIVLRPGMRELTSGHLAAFILMICSSSIFVILRYIKHDEHTISHFGAATVLPMGLCGVMVIPDFQLPPLSLWFPIGIYGVFIALGNLMIMFASRYAPANLIGPTQYSQVAWAVGYGVFVFHDPIDVATIAGLTLIVLAGAWKYTPLPRLMGWPGDVDSSA